MRQLLISSPIARTDRAGRRRFLETNPAMQEALGYSADELRGMTLTDVTYPEDMSAYAQINQELQEG